MSHTHPQSMDTINRLKRIEGHVRGIREMAEAGKPCADLLLQIAAVLAAVRKVGVQVLQEHLDSCVMAAEAGEARAQWQELRRALANFTF